MIERWKESFRQNPEKAILTFSVVVPGWDRPCVVTCLKFFFMHSLTKQI